VYRSHVYRSPVHTVTGRLAGAWHLELQLRVRGSLGEEFKGMEMERVVAKPRPRQPPRRQPKWSEVGLNEVHATDLNWFSTT
jgi:hypothetical protein